MDSKPLTDEQIENYRKVLIGMIGPYALIIPRNQIEAYRNRLQETIDAAEERGVQKEIEHQTRMARGKADYEMRAAERQDKTR